MPPTIADSTKNSDTGWRNLLLMSYHDLHFSGVYLFDNKKVIALLILTVK